jgi:CRP-like cAMP-binding protein
MTTRKHHKRDAAQRERRAQLKVRTLEYIMDCGIVDTEDISNAIGISAIEAGRIASELARDGVLDHEIEYTKTHYYWPTGE